MGQPVHGTAGQHAGLPRDTAVPSDGSYLPADDKPSVMRATAYKPCGLHLPDDSRRYWWCEARNWPNAWPC